MERFVISFRSATPSADQRGTGLERETRLFAARAESKGQRAAPETARVGLLDSYATNCRCFDGPSIFLRGGGTRAPFRPVCPRRQRIGLCLRLMDHCPAHVRAGPAKCKNRDVLATAGRARSLNGLAVLGAEGSIELFAIGGLRRQRDRV